jgi:two-component system NtrC family sensor kinase
MRYEKRQLLLFIQEKKQEQEAAFDKIIQLKGDSLNTYALDYSYWDEMVTFVKIGNLEWAKANIDSSLPTFKVDGAMIYNTEGLLRYKVFSQNRDALGDLSFSLQEIKEMFSKSQFCHFFTMTPLGLTEIRAATINPTSDLERKGEPKGYFFAVKLWDNVYLSQLSYLTKSKISLVSPEKRYALVNITPVEGVIAFARGLNNWDNKPLVYLEVRVESEATRSFNRQMKQRYSIIIPVLLFFSGMVFVLYIFWVYYPLRSISWALNAENDDFISKLRDRNDEFGDIARMIGESFKRKKILVKEIEERKMAEERLKEAYFKLKETQNQLIQAEKLNAVGQLASGVAHEVKNPLAIIIQAVDYLEGKTSAACQEALQMIKNNIKRADNIVRTLLDFSRKSDLLDVSLEDINSIIENTLVLIQHSAAPNNIEIIREFNRGISRVLVDKNKMEQVFVNIFLNAIQAMPAGGKIFIRTYEAEFKKPVENILNTFKPGEKTIVIEIEDTGEGISEENLEKVFDPFFTTWGLKGGAGLGLSVTNNIINMHKGLIEIKSRQGEGTKVIITLKVEGGSRDGKK